MKKVIVSGASGLVGTQLRDVFNNLGWKVVSLSRRETGEGFVKWNPLEGMIDRDAIEGCDCVINLAGESLAAGRWTKERRRLILESRVKSTHLLVETLAKLKKPPKVMISASGSHYYADNEGGSPWDESGSRGRNFVAELCARWEEATEPAAKIGVRVVNARLGVVLSANGGLLTRLLPAVCSGLGGIVGDGNQRISWIHIDDLARAFVLIMQREELFGPVNIVAPHPVTNGDFTREAARLLKRPCFVKMPKSAITWLFGDMGTQLLLADNAVIPGKLMEFGMQWEFENHCEALSDIIENRNCHGMVW
jgi:uncharacterized protein